MEHDLGITPLLARILVRRGFDDPRGTRTWIQPDISALHPPELLPDLAAAVARLRTALERRERILIHGDYDVDGVCGTVLLVQLLRTLRADVSWFIPDRVKDGYSFGPGSIAAAVEAGATLVISVDNGISASAPIAELAARGIDVIVTDHHEVGSAIPIAAAVVNPKRADSRYPFREICGTAVAFKLAWALCETLTARHRESEEVRGFLRDALAWVAIGTICDVMPMVDENRALVRFGLQAIRRSPNLGLRALLDHARIGERALTPRDISFRVGPRINAAGRVAHAGLAVRLFTAESFAEAQELASSIEALNEERQRLDQETTAQAIERVRREIDLENARAIVLADERWKAGIIGIAAARLVEEFHLPTVLIALEGARGKGSGRSIPGVNLLEGLDACAEQLLRHGGHAYAAGLEIERERVEELRIALDRALTDRSASRASRPPLMVDAETTPAELTPPVVAELSRLAPFGPGNEVPRLLSEGLRPVGLARLSGRERQHLCFRVHGDGTTLEAIAYHAAPRADELMASSRVALLFTPIVVKDGRKESVRLEVHDFRPHA
ncbi:MAG: single-stranded-DNA-specific exonuclease RecJ [Planctomycetes bacterium]|nr:single-stranded-DNA-specific exonuclease RecJ [Planctomycetota bacterium]